MSAPEVLIWSRLRMDQLKGFRFYRQRPLGNYIVDFYSPRAGLVIEVDGNPHYEGTRPESDKEKDRYLADNGLKVLRFSNHEVMRSIDGVIERIISDLK